MNSDVRLETNVVAVDRADLLPPSSVSAVPAIAGVETHSSFIVWPFFISIVLIVMILWVFKKIRSLPLT